jgi:hypothetical protein
VSRGKGRQRWHCKACDKVAFGSEARAREVIDMVTPAYVGTSHQVPRRVYPCPYNNGYHLTKLEERKK